MKNIPIPSRDEYLMQLIYSVEKFIRNLRWRAFFFLNPEKRGREKEYYGFSSIRALQEPIPELKLFEQRLTAMIRDVEFRSFSNDFQERIKQDVRTIRDTQELIIEADKTSNKYKLPVPDYQRLLDKGIHKEYKKAAPQDLRRANDSQKEVVKSYGLGERVMATQARPARASLKDHKPHFQDDPKIRLINPTKPEIGRISKKILQKIITAVKAKTKFNQWINSDDVISWFTALPNKERLKFISFDMCSMYPSISEKLLKNALQWASQYVEISEKDKTTILASKASLLYDLEKGAWKKKGDLDFDITMGSWDGAETCDICVLYLLSKVQHLPIKIGAYRDDWLAVSSQTTRLVEKTKQEIAKIFKANGLSLEIEANHTSINFLDVTFNLSTGLFSPYMKPNNKIFYVHSKSNHPKSILKNLPKNIENRLSKISANENIFKEAIPPYQAALEASGYNHDLTFDPNARQGTRPQRKNRNRNVTWFNPPWSNNVKSNIGKQFLAILKESFPPTHKLHKICNKNYIKLSYRCMPNIRREISKHNNKVLYGENRAAVQNEVYDCNCLPLKTRETCKVMPGIGCQVTNVVYKATVTRNDTSQVETYTGSTAQTMKGRWNGHNYDIRHPEVSGTCLSKYIHKLSGQGI